MANNKYKFFILTGEPGVGKTTLTKKLSSAISSNGIKTAGFYTEEIRSSRIREGFDIVTFNGARARLARDECLLLPPIKHRVGKYGVLVEEFENLALPALQKPDSNEPQLLVIDEIGKMEFFSQRFKNAVKEIFSPTSDYIVLATIPVRMGDKVIETIRNHSQARVWMITKENRNTIHNEILKEMNKVFNIIVCKSY
ncbi:unnamed protein product [Chrysodeixis includens]|uniref:AAA+ ATPase domain-containing protein n=1 Tax=Chrysodeixis includens TaxID=689277 RepID=A0A9P0FRU8_CHRIL|nr:unnamed protein product [Chrysodeixis includens]